MDGAICISSRSVVIGGCRCSTRRRVAQVHFFSFLLTAPPMRDSTVAIHRNVKKRGVPHASGLRVGVCLMPEGLKRYYGRGHLHFLTFSCYRRLPLLNTTAGGPGSLFFFPLDGSTDERFHCCNTPER